MKEDPKSFRARLGAASEALGKGVVSAEDADNLRHLFREAVASVTEFREFEDIRTFLQRFDEAVSAGWVKGAGRDCGPQFVAMLRQRKALSRLRGYEAMLLRAEIDLGPVTRDVEDRLARIVTMLKAYQPSDSVAAQGLMVEGAGLIRAAKLPGDVRLIEAMFLEAVDIPNRQGSVTGAWADDLRTRVSSLSDQRLRGAIIGQLPGILGRKFVGGSELF